MTSHGDLERGGLGVGALCMHAWAELGVSYGSWDVDFYSRGRSGAVASVDGVGLGIGTAYVSYILWK